MTVTFTHRITGTGVGGSCTISGANTALQAGRLYLLSVGTNNSTNTPEVDPSVTQSGNTWTLLRGHGYGSNTRRRVSLFCCQRSTPLAATDIVITYPTGFNVLAIVDESSANVLQDIAGNGVGAVPSAQRNSVGGVSGTMSVTLPSPKSANGVIHACCHITGAPGISATSPAVELADVISGSNEIASTWSTAAQTTAMLRGGGTSGEYGMIAVEVREQVALVDGSVHAVANPTNADVEAAAVAHYGPGTTVAQFIEMLDSEGPRTPDAFCQAWWGKDYVDSIPELLLLERFVQLIRQSAHKDAPFADGPTYVLGWLGGDMYATAQVSQGDDTGRRYWVASDYLFANSADAVNLATNEFNDIAVSIRRNFQLAEFRDGEVDVAGVTRTADALGAGFRTMAGPNTTTWVTPGAAFQPPTHPYNTLYWLLALTPSHQTNFIFYAGAWLVDEAPGLGILNSQLRDTHILHINGFGTVSAVASFDLGPGRFYVSDIIEDVTYYYVFFREYDPGYGDFTPSHFENLNTDTTYAHVARVPVVATPMATGHTGSVFTDYEWWTGTAWSSDSDASARLVDQNGTEIPGDAGFAILDDGSWIMTAQRYFEAERRVYKTATPGSAWTHIASVPTPLYPTEIVPDLLRTCIHMKVHPFMPAPEGHVMSMSHTMGFEAFPGADPTEPPISGRHINAWNTPYFIAVPTEATGGPTVTLWNGAAEEPLTVTEWNGATEAPLTLDQIT